MPLYLWGRLAEPGEAAWDVGRRRAAREEGSFSYRNATIIEQYGQYAGCLIGYAIPDNPEPVPDDMPAMFVPLQELENLVPGTWYINVLAVQPQFRRQGLGARLLALADERAEKCHRFRRQHWRAAALRALRLQGECHEVDGQRELEERGAKLGSADEGPLK